MQSTFVMCPWPMNLPKMKWWPGNTRCSERAPHAMTICALYWTNLLTFLSKGEVAVHERHVPRSEELVEFEKENQGAVRSMPTGHGGHLYTRF